MGKQNSSESSDTLMTEDWEEDSYICLGMTKGRALFYDVANFGRLVAKYEVAKNDI